MWKPEVEEINDIPKTLVGKIAKQEIRKDIKNILSTYSAPLLSTVNCSLLWVYMAFPVERPINHFSNGLYTV